MLIAEFARATNMSPDTIRFYVRRGLLQPSVSSKGGRNPYQLFTGEHVRTAQIIRLGQALGLSLKEIGMLLLDAREGRLTPDRTLAAMREHRDRLRRRSSELGFMADYLEAKISWMSTGSRGPEPSFREFVDRDEPAPPAARATTRRQPPGPGGRSASAGP